MFRKSDPGTAWARLSVLLKRGSLRKAPRTQVSDLQSRKKKLTLRNKSLALQRGPEISLSTYFYPLSAVPSLFRLAAHLSESGGLRVGRSWVESWLCHLLVCATLRSHLTPELWVGRAEWQSGREEALSVVEEMIVIAVRVL